MDSGAEGSETLQPIVFPFHMLTSLSFQPILDLNSLLSSQLSPLRVTMYS